MFNGAAKYGPKQFDNEMEKAGGNNNAYTLERRSSVGNSNQGILYEQLCAMAYEAHPYR